MAASHEVADHGQKRRRKGIRYQPGWILATTTTVKIFIDVVIGLWAFILGDIWTNYIDKGPDKAKPAEIWQRFPKFILGFIFVFAVSLWLAVGSTPEIAKALPAAGRRPQHLPGHLLYPDLLFDRRLLSDFRKLWQQGFGKLAAVYFVSLFGFVIWVGLLISWLFFSGFKPPLIKLIQGESPCRNPTSRKKSTQRPRAAAADREKS